MGFFHQLGLVTRAVTPLLTMLRFHQAMQRPADSTLRAMQVSVTPLLLVPSNENSVHGGSRLASGAIFEGSSKRKSLSELY
jgi:hypothetical protein